MCVFLNTSGGFSERWKEGRQYVFPDASSLGAEGRVTGDEEQNPLLSLEAGCLCGAWVPSSPCSHASYLGCFQSELGLGAGAVVAPSGEVGPLWIGRANSHQVRPEITTVTSKILLI